MSGAVGGIFFEAPNWTIKNAKSVPMQRGARSVFRRSVPMQRGARFLIFGDRSMVQHGVDEGINNMYKTHAIMHMFKVKCTPGAATKWIPKSKICKKTFENK